MGNPKVSKAKSLKGKEPIKGKEPSKIKAPTKPKLTEGYKDPYSKTIYESKEAFYKMKCSHASSKFSKLNNKILEIVNKGKSPVTIDIPKELGVSHIAVALPAYVLNFVKEFSKVKEVEKWHVKNNVAKDMPETNRFGKAVKGSVKFELVKA